MVLCVFCLSLLDLLLQSVIVVDSQTVLFRNGIPHWVGFGVGLWSGLLLFHSVANFEDRGFRPPMAGELEGCGIMLIYSILYFISFSRVVVIAYVLLKNTTQRD